MGRIVVSVKVENALMPSIPAMQMDALVDTGSSRLTLPNAWRERLGDFPRTRKAVAHTASETVDAIICSPAVITIAGFPQIDGEILFMDMEPIDGEYQPILGYIPLESCEALADMQSHCLRKAKYVDA